MRLVSWVSVVTALLSVASPARAADDLGVERLATCQDSWLDWKGDPSKGRPFTDHFRSAFTQKKETDAFFIPKTATTVMGLSLLQVFPESIGMAVGFSVVVDANFDQTRKVLEQKVGKALKACETGDNMRTCSLELGEKKTILLLAEDSATSKTTLMGCFYYYEK